MSAARLATLVQAARARGQGVLIVTLPAGAIQRIFCPYCGQPYTKHAQHLAGAGIIHERCRNRWCATLAREDGHTETVVYFHTVDEEAAE